MDAVVEETMGNAESCGDEQAGPAMDAVVKETGDVEPGDERAELRNEGPAVQGVSGVVPTMDAVSEMDEENLEAEGPTGRYVDKKAELVLVKEHEDKAEMPVRYLRQRQQPARYMDEELVPKQQVMSTFEESASDQKQLEVWLSKKDPEYQHRMDRYRVMKSQRLSDDESVQVYRFAQEFKTEVRNLAPEHWNPPRDTAMPVAEIHQFFNRGECWWSHTKKVLAKLGKKEGAPPSDSTVAGQRNSRLIERLTVEDDGRQRKKKRRKQNMVPLD
ncbi:hypothetical protein FA15DRAFT_661400 [Coprinopsis marcescibilis]|uniref:Uncharacterized protein n=1 Tax=Coprinopsis marcescibilis TaxID=230819 RepID=A0A5C3KC50_COPMA|nr:hypothetical protein FA15DRAFT_661400 [Coprinopsis marcescibilis]